VSRALAKRGVSVWIGTRMLISSVFLLAGVNPMELPYGTTIGVIAIATAVGFVQTARMREQVFLANVGIPLLATTPFLLAPAIAGEMLIRGLWEAMR
jgi:4-hydroxybenzoate polyprenyltransferase